MHPEVTGSAVSARVATDFFGGSASAKKSLASGGPALSRAETGINFAC